MNYISMTIRLVKTDLIKVWSFIMLALLGGFGMFCSNG